MQIKNTLQSKRKRDETDIKRPRKSKKGIESLKSEHKQRKTKQELEIADEQKLTQMASEREKC